MSGGHYLALASAGTGETEEREWSGESQEVREGGTCASVADRKLGSCTQVGGAVGVVSEELSEEVMQ